MSNFSILLQKIELLNIHSPSVSLFIPEIMHLPPPCRWTPVCRTTLHPPPTPPPAPRKSFSSPNTQPLPCSRHPRPRPRHAIAVFREGAARPDTCSVLDLIPKSRSYKKQKHISTVSESYYFFPLPSPYEVGGAWFIRSKSASEVFLLGIIVPEWM